MWHAGWQFVEILHGLHRQFQMRLCQACTAWLNSILNNVSSLHICLQVYVAVLEPVAPLDDFEAAQDAASGA
jgi:hypothetical protein